MILFARRAEPFSRRNLAMAAAVFALALPQPAGAQQRIGAASAIQNEVSALRGGANVRLASGGPVFRSEAISTGAGSSTRLTFLDDTNLSIGPSSRVVLDEFVYAGGSQARNVTLNLARGAFRFATGSSDKSAYQIRTSTATIGVRGTVLDILSRDGQTIVTLMDDGAAFLCVTGTARCGTLNVRGQSFVVDTSGVRRTDTPRTRFTFQQFCQGAAGLCGRTRLADRGSDDRPPPPLELIREIAQTRELPQAGCNTGQCNPASSALLWGGLATGIAMPTPYDVSFSSFGFQLPSTQRVPLAAGDIVSVAINDSGSNFSASGTIAATLQVDPGFQYTAWGEWNGAVTVAFSGNTNAYTYGPSSVTFNRGFAVFGAITPSTTIEARTGTATYSGPVLADFAPQSGGPVLPGAVGGSSTITADFGARTVSGSFNLTMGNATWANPTFSNAPINLNTINGKGASFDSVLNVGTYGSGSISGGFLGPNGQEMAGEIFVYNPAGSNPGTAFGIFRGRQGGVQ